MRRALRWLFLDRTADRPRWVVAQWPNTSAWTFLLLTGLGWFVPGDPVWLYAGTRVALVWWAVDEIARGVNPFRRLLGAGTLVVAATGVVQRL